MIPKSSYHNFSEVIDNGKIRRIPIVFTEFRILDITGAESVLVKFQGGKFTRFYEGMAFNTLPDSLEWVEIQNDSGSQITVECTLSIGQVVDDRRTAASTVNVAVGDTIDEGEVDVDATAAASCKIPTRSTRKSVIITNTGTATLYFQNASGTGTTPASYPLEPGDSLILETTDDVFCYKDTSASGQKFHYLETYS